VFDLAAFGWVDCWERGRQSGVAVLFCESTAQRWQPSGMGEGLGVEEYMGEA
jgi:hypothetical protein